jgi:hypothetical protein
MEKMKQFWIEYIYMWKCHNETSCTAILSIQKCLLLKNEGQEGKNRYCLRVGPSGRGEDTRKGCIGG